MLSFEPRHYEHFAIGGRLIGAASAERVDVIGANTGEAIGRTISAQNGMPLWLSRQLEGGYIAAFLRYYAELAQAQQIEERRRSPLGFD